MRRLYGPFVQGPGAVGLLFLRLAVGAAFMFHGWPKIHHPLDWMHGSPIPGFLQALGAIAEFGGGLAWVLGLLTPIAAFGITCTMLTALGAIHLPHGDPFVSTGGPSFELALSYLSVALLLLLQGPGRYSLDWLLFGRGKESSVA